MMDLSLKESQDLRHAVLYAVARRPTVPQTAGQVSVCLKRLVPFDFSPADVDVSLKFHVGLGNVELILDPWGAEETYKPTSAGIIAYERDQNKIA